MKSRLRIFFDDIIEFYRLFKVAAVTFLILYLVQALSTLAFGYGEFMDGTWAGMKVPPR